MGKKRVLPLIMIGLAGIVGLSLSGCKGNENVAAGHELYVHYCVGCHGEKGDGNGFNALFVDPPPSDHTDPDLGEKSNKKLFKTVAKGGKGSGRSAKMPPFGEVLSEKEIWQLVGYMRTLHPSSAPAIEYEGKSDERPKYAKAKVPDFPAADSAEWAKFAKKGKKLYRRNACKACHRIGEDGGRIGPELARAGDRLRPEWVYKWLKSPQSIYKDTKMPNFKLSDKDATALSAYISTLKGEMGVAGSRGDPLFFEALNVQ